MYNYFWLFLYHFICDCSAGTAVKNPLSNCYVTCIAEVSTTKDSIFKQLKLANRVVYGGNASGLSVCRQHIILLVAYYLGVAQYHY